jgi:hypothetical protein
LSDGTTEFVCVAILEGAYMGDCSTCEDCK